MVAFLFADADEDRDVRAEGGGFEASPADDDADAMAEAAAPALMPSMASLAPRRGTAELSTAPFPFRPFLFFFWETTILFFHSEIFAKRLQSLLSKMVYKNSTRQVYIGQYRESRFYIFYI